LAVAQQLEMLIKLIGTDQLGEQQRADVGRIV